MKQKTIYSCQQCGYQSPKWLGRCPDCGQWNTLTEERRSAPAGKNRPVSVAAPVQRIAEVTAEEEDRCRCGIGEFDRVLGGGWCQARWC